MNLSRSPLLSSAAILSALLVVWNDLWLKRHHPGLISGKLSDVGLLVFFPLFLLAAVTWLGAKPSTRLHFGACLVAALYFIAIKAWPAATHAHVAWLSFVMPRWHFRAVTDPTDLLCLPAVLIAWRTMKGWVRANVLKEQRSSERFPTTERCAAYSLSLSSPPPSLVPPPPSSRSPRRPLQTSRPS